MAASSKLIASVEEIFNSMDYGTAPEDKKILDVSCMTFCLLFDLIYDM